ncbi:nocobactin polyketide synthase NbtC [Nocardia australiensis]|uniref:nocobactin polyketide synthase NbtC n=1 Tax=Nocardia australiensis TaxID=2887191 RepID=UPI001D136CE1|nr:nocobactin polyketide synthase NbtC [Nocardia australiensis]
MSDYRLPDGTIPVSLSSDTEGGVRGEAAAIRNYLEQHPHVSPDQLADMLFRTRVARRYRALAMVDDRDQLLDALSAIVAGAEHSAVVSTTGVASARRIGFVFPGQGSQRPGMGALYYAASEAYRAEIDACAQIHDQRFGHSGPLHYLLGHEGEYADAVWEVQPALMFHMAGLAAMWRAAGVEPAATVGHSQGELAAGAVSGVMTRRDSVLAVTHRARLVERISPRGYSMAVLGMDRDSCEDLMARNSGWAELSVINSPHILAISGDQDTIVEMVATATAKGQFAREIRVAYPAHTSIVAELRADFEAFLGDEMSSLTFADSDVPCYGATLGAAIGSELRQEEYWYWNLRNRVRFDRAIVAAAADGVDTFVEVSEHPMLQLAVQENLTLVPHEVGLAPREFQVIGTSVRTATGLAEFTRNLATVVVHDLNYRWEALRVESDSAAPVRLPLRDFPNTVLNPQKLWAAQQYETAPRLDAAAAAGRYPDRLAEKWIRLERRSLVSPRTLLIVDPTGRCGDMAAALGTAAYNHGGSATVFDPATPEPAGHDTVVVLLAELPDMDGPAAVREVADFFESPWLPTLDASITDCWLLTIGGESVLADDRSPHLFHGALSAGFRCIGMEHIGTAFRHLDLESPDADADAIVRALHAKDEPQLALRDRGLYAKRLEVDSQPVAESIGPGANDLDHVVIVGGTGTLGLKFGEYLAERGARRITLLSRSGATDAVAGRLRAIREIGAAEVVVVACDVTDEAAVRRFVSAHADPVSMLVHAGVNYVGAELADVTSAKVLEMASSKIIGTELLLRSLPLTEDCRIIICSSAAATFGGRGQILYATVNRMLDVLAMRLRATGMNAVAVQWGIWDLAGPLHAVGLDRVTAAGVVPMDPGAALTVGLTEHAERGRPGNRLVAAADWAQVHALMSAVGFGPILTEVLDQVPRHEPPSAAVVPDAVEQVPVVPTGASLSDQVRTQLGKVMGTEGDNGFDGSVPLVALGLDSLQALDFRKRVRAELNRDLPVAAILGGASLDDVVRLMAGSNV